jgi:GNAT superfamily N-acetyltransferase
MASSQTDEERCNILAEDVIFSEASPGQLTTVWTLNAAAWAEPLSIKDHIERERTLSQQPATSERWKTFVLTLKDNSSEIVASLETFEKPVFVSDGAGCKVEKGYGIASVFTNPKYRGNRMASVLLDKVKQWLDGDGEGWISVLYSDIGGVCLETFSPSLV